MEFNIAGLPAITAPATFCQGIKDSLPIVIGICRWRSAFGLYAVKRGFTPLEGLFISSIICAGANQFVITTMLSASVSLCIATMMVMTMNCITYCIDSAATIHSWRIDARKTVLWAFDVTYAVFVAAISRLSRDNRS